MVAAFEDVWFDSDRSVDDFTVGDVSAVLSATRRRFPTRVWMSPKRLCLPDESQELLALSTMRTSMVPRSNVPILVIWMAVNPA